MSISAIKENLSIREVLSYYQIPVKNQHCLCPFHEDKTPSMQVFEDSNSVRCYSGNCVHSNKVIDVIDFIMFYEKISKAQAFAKAKELANYDFRSTYLVKVRDTEIKENFLAKMFEYFKVALPCSPFAKEYALKRVLDYKILEIGYNSGQFHHGVRKNKELIENSLEVGLLLDKGFVNNRTLEKAYYVFGNKSLVFSLKDKNNQITGFYFRSLEEKEAKHLYLKNRKGLYPSYPPKETKKLILTESIIDAATLLQISAIKQKYEVLACYGVNGFTQEHRKAISQLTELNEVIFAFDKDPAGEKAIYKLQREINQLKENLTFSSLELPNKDVNEVLQLHEPNIFLEIISQRKPLVSQIKQGNIEEIENTNTGSNSFTLSSINQLIEQTGIIGEENTRLLLFIIASSYKTPKPLHAIIQGSSGSGKTHLISKIADLIPQEDVLRFTRITESSLYNWGEFDLVGKCIVIEDLDGLKEEALYSLREIISSQKLSSSVSIKDKKGNIKSTQKNVRGIFSSLSATTKGDIYEDNMSRSFILAVDESLQQSQKIIEYQNKKYAGEVSKIQEKKAREQLQEYVRSLQNLEVINPFATRLHLPQEVHKIRRLNEMYQSIIKQVTFLHQKNRKIKDHCIITEKEDLQLATEVLFDSIILKIDELDGSLRQFFEKLKDYLKNKEKEFYLREIRQKFNISKTQMFRYIQNLKELDYIRSTGGQNATGYKYKIIYWDDFEKLRKQIKEQLQEQINNL